MPTRKQQRKDVLDQGGAEGHTLLEQTHVAAPGVVIVAVVVIVTIAAVVAGGPVGQGEVRASRHANGRRVAQGGAGGRVRGAARSELGPRGARGPAPP